jgi:hypothetical protein
MNGAPTNERNFTFFITGNAAMVASANYKPLASPRYFFPRSTKGPIGEPVTASGSSVPIGDRNHLHLP